MCVMFQSVSCGKKIARGRCLASSVADLKERLYDEHRIEIPVTESDAGRLIRASFQGYNDEGDLERLRAALNALL